MLVHIKYMAYLVVILIGWFGKSHKNCQIKCIPFILQASVALLVKTINLKSSQQRPLSKSPNIQLTNNSMYAVICTITYIQYVLIYCDILIEI